MYFSMYSLSWSSLPTPPNLNKRRLLKEHTDKSRQPTFRSAMGDHCFVTTSIFYMISVSSLPRTTSKYQAYHSNHRPRRYNYLTMLIIFINLCYTKIRSADVERFTRLNQLIRIPVVFEDERHRFAVIRTSHKVNVSIW